MSTQLLKDYIATRYGTKRGSQKDFLKDNPHMTNSEVSRWISSEYRIDLDTGTPFKVGNKLVNLKDPVYMLSEVPTPPELNENQELFSQGSFYLSSEDANKKNNAYLVKSFAKDGFLVVAETGDTQVHFSEHLWDSNGSKYSIVDGVVHTI
ncbi:hypothetical protein [Vibrio europaeus]|uniref:hypothetical protein n=1 Tax=Vibrio europaeus TaxID=300876 RepID=UPI00233E8CC3|nr:hypothetical protein [Vibrio europaeus]MDC5711173.1 hypothetical protein [Vibrio europaeus]MDC5713202.1 hypothetical protein [Vibrio europaeus]